MCRLGINYILNKGILFVYCARSNQRCIPFAHPWLRYDVVVLALADERADGIFGCAVKQRKAAGRELTWNYIAGPVSCL